MSYLDCLQIVLATMSCIARHFSTAILFAAFAFAFIRLLARS